jgi:hypothetical protein
MRVIYRIPTSPQYKQQAHRTIVATVRSVGRPFRGPDVPSPLQCPFYAVASKTPLRRPLSCERIRFFAGPPRTWAR